MGFADDCRSFTLRVESRNADVLTGCVLEATRSIVEGSEITGAPGQPVDTGTLKASWQTVQEGPSTWLIGSGGAAADYNQIIEDGMRPLGSGRGNVTGNTGQRLTLRSQVGGFHSVALTVAGWLRIVETVTARVAGAP